MQNIEEMKFQYESAFEQAKNEVGRLLTASPPVVRDYTSHLALSMGKFIRAASVIACAMESGGQVGGKAVKMAAAVEILHLATLVHDDVIDNADLRRGELTLQKKYGKRTAVICGDYLVCLAMKLAASASDKTDMEDYMELEIPDYMSKVCLGELNQHVNNGNVDLTVPQYLRIIKGKTAALFEASFFTGAALAEKERRIINQYAKLGHNIGMIFQLTDDCMDFEETEEAAKKPVQSDYEQNVITLPLIHAFKHLPELRKKAKEQKISRREINEAVRETGGLEYTRQIAQKYYSRSLKLIRELDLAEEKESRLRAILDRACRLA
ncbi:MAG TPA: polyprenyl synthetase family protein [Anaerovoracaceae bacterium]|nr:polyprenyl synthetase family protein [Anaerovoracaceae bacterium]